MKSASSKPALYIKTGQDLALSSQALLEILKSVLDKGRPFRFRVRGFSMSPLIKDGDVLTISPPSEHEFHNGDVVLFEEELERRPIVHRIVHGQGDMFLVKGDNLGEADGYIHRKSILGTVTCVERRGRKIRIGLGKERRLLALMSRKKIVTALLVIPRFILRLFRRSAR